MNRDIVLSPQSLLNSDPSEDDVGVKEDTQEAVLLVAINNKTVFEEMFTGRKIV